MFLLKRQSKAIDNATQDFQQFGYAIMMLRFINKSKCGMRLVMWGINLIDIPMTSSPVKDIVDLLSNKCSQAQKFSIDAM